MSSRRRVVIEATNTSIADRFSNYDAPAGGGGGGGRSGGRRGDMERYSAPRGGISERLGGRRRGGGGQVSVQIPERQYSARHEVSGGGGRRGGGGYGDFAQKKIVKGGRGGVRGGGRGGGRGGAPGGRGGRGGRGGGRGGRGGRGGGRGGRGGGRGKPVSKEDLDEELDSYFLSNKEVGTSMLDKELEDYMKGEDPAADAGEGEGEGDVGDAGDDAGKEKAE